MKELSLERMSELKGGGCAGAIAGDIAVTIAAGALIYATGGLAAWALAGWVASKVAATVNVIEECTSSSSSSSSGTSSKK